MAKTLRASQSGLELVNQARQRKLWNKGSEAWCSQAFVSKSTLNRFWVRQAIRQEAFINICKAVGLFWAQVADLEDAELDEVHRDMQKGCQDWGLAPDPSNFYGRVAEISTLQQWIVEDRCRLVTVLGMGGIGKTSLTTYLAHMLQDQFDFIIWRSLRDAPSIDTILTDWIQGVSRQQEIHLPGGLNEKVRLLLQYLRTARCLLILDNVESILQGRNRFGLYQEEHEGYGEVFQQIAKTPHQSCLILTSRELPVGISILASDWLAVRKYTVGGMVPDEMRVLLTEDGMMIEQDSAWSKLIDHYGGNPLALKIMATVVKDLFDNSISNYLVSLSNHSCLFEDIRDLLEQQFKRLRPIEQAIMYWLAINREPVSLATLGTDLVGSITVSKTLQALTSLQHRSLIEKVIDDGDSNVFTLQPVVMEYITARLIDRITDEIVCQTPELFDSHALVKATNKEYLQKSQLSLILKPLSQHMIARLGSKKNLITYLNQILDQLRTHVFEADHSATSVQRTIPEPGYAGGNILNLLRHVGADLSGYDFSSLAIRQANLQGLTMHHVNFAGADLSQTVFTETLGNILSVSFSPDGQLLATCDTDCNIRLWDLQSFQLQRICLGHTNWVRAVAFSPDGQSLASASADKTVKLWDVETGQCLRTFIGHPYEICDLAFHPSGTFIASSGGRGVAKLWDVESGDCLVNLNGHTNWIRSIAFNHDGQTLATASDDQSIKLWDANTGDCLRTLSGHGARVCSVSFNYDSTLLASGSGDHTVKVWAVRSGNCLKTIHSHQAPVYAVAFCSNENILASGSGDHTIKIWNWQTQDCIETLQGHNNQIVALSFSPEGKSLICVSLDQTVKLWSWRSRQCQKTFMGNTDWAFPVAISPDGQLLATAASNSTVKLWDIQTGSCLQTLEGHTDLVYSVAFSPDGKFLASASTDQTVRLWKNQTGESYRTLQGHQDWIFSVAFCPTGKKLATASADQTVRLWDWRRGQCIQTLKGHTDKIFTVTFSPDGKTVLSGSSDQSIRLWHAATGQCLNILKGHEGRVYSIAFSPDGSFLASGSTDQTVKLWDYLTGQCTTTLKGHSNWVFSVAVSPRGNLIASGSHDGTIKLWDLNTGHCRNTCSGHHNLVSSVTFSPDGSYIASGSQDQSVKLWNTYTGKHSRTIRSPRLYEGMNIEGAVGLNDAQKLTLQSLGARY